MATITSATSGNFSAGATWVGGVVPAPADIAVAATTHVVTIDVNTTVTKVTQAGTGKFVLGNGRTLTAEVEANAGTFTSGGTVECTATTSATIQGNITGISTTTAATAAVVITGSGLLTVNGTVTPSPGGATSGSGIYINTSCSLIVNGNLLPAPTANSNKRSITTGSSTTNCAITVNGTVTGNNGAPSMVLDGNSLTVNINGAVSNPCVTLSANSSTVNIVGSLGGSSGTGQTGINLGGTNSTMNITGNLNYAGGVNGPGLSQFGTGSKLYVTGNVSPAGSASAISISSNDALTVVTGNLSTGGAQSAIQSTGTSAVLNITGNIIPSGSATAVSVTGASATVNVVGTTYGFSTNVNGITSSSTANGVIYQGNMVDSAGGAKAVYTRLFRLTATNNGYTQYTNTVGYPNGTPVTRVSPNLVTGMPSAGDVRKSTVYGYNNELTGTMSVPSPSSVALNVPVDNTVGTAVLDAGSVVAVVGAQVAAASSNPSVV